MHRICFIDDDGEFEIPLFTEVLGDTYDIIAETDYKAAQAKFAVRGQWRPDLFVLDMYFPMGSPDDSALNALRTARPAYVDDDVQIRAAYTNFLTAESRLHHVLDAWRQTPRGGLELASRITHDYPDVPIVFYSRKATFEDIVRCLAADNVWGVAKKPSGADDDDTRRLTHTARDHLSERFNRVINRQDAHEVERIKQAASVITNSLLDA